MVFIRIHQARKVGGEASVVMMQEFAPDLVLADYVLVGGSALADKLNIPKAVVGIPGLMQPIMSYDFGSGSHLLATSPQWQMLHSRNMVRHH